MNETTNESDERAAKRLGLVDRPGPPEFPHPSRVTASGPDYVTGLLPKCPECPLAEGHDGDHLGALRFTIEISSERLTAARVNFPASFPAGDPNEWSPTDFRNAIGQAGFEIVDYEEVSR